MKVEFRDKDCRFDPAHQGAGMNPDKARREMLTPAPPIPMPPGDVELVARSELDRRLKYEVWRGSSRGWVFERAFRWRWLARLYAWEHTKRKWFIYEVRAHPEADR